MTVILQKGNQSRNNSVIARPFNFNIRTGSNPVAFDEFKKHKYSKENKFLVPDWFKKYCHPD
jgi:hypothetical protein